MGIPDEFRFRRVMLAAGRLDTVNAIGIRVCVKVNEVSGQTVADPNAVAFSFCFSAHVRGILSAVQAALRVGNGVF